VYLSCRHNASAANGSYSIRLIEGTNLGTAAAITPPTAVATSRSLLVNATAPSGVAWTAALLNNTNVRETSVIGVAGNVHITEQWVYAEIQVKINLDDPATSAEAIASIKAKFTVDDALALADTLSIKAKLTVDDALIESAAIASIKAKFTVADDWSELDQASYVLYLPSTGSSSNMIFLNDD
jgi:hypothetical protein